MSDIEWAYKANKNNSDRGLLYNSNWQFKFVVLLGCSQPQLKNYLLTLDKTTDPSEMIAPFGNEGAAMAICWDGFHILAFADQAPDVGDVAHEALHLASRVLDQRGVPFDPDHHESHAYLVGWIVSKVFEVYKKLHKS